MDLKTWMKDHPPKGFKPLPVYSHIGDMLTWHWSEELAYADPIMVDGINIGCVLRDMNTKQPVGVKIYGLKAMIGENP